MIKTVSESEFVQKFDSMNRGENFSREGRMILFDYLEELERDLGEPMELDVIALCCEYGEGTPEDIADYYDIDLSDINYDEDELKRIVLDYLNKHTTVVGQATGEGTIVYRQF